ncbi:MAG: DUF1343 domain-containing protein [Calditrichaeota bacterium]|nr:MAG: DUF1343 domain-containing protein [Calditrichota bacterium]
MYHIPKYFLTISLIMLFGCTAGTSTVQTKADVRAGKPAFRTGLENFLGREAVAFKGKKLGLITNPSAVDDRLVPAYVRIHEHPDLNLTALYGPEHGLFSAAGAGEKVGHATEPRFGLPVYSLYGATRQPTPEMLKDIDVLIFDIQDIGIRSYTYIYTMALAMQAAKRDGKTFVVLDRPNPLGGEQVEGNVAREEFFSFVGMYPIAYRHGMTAGELALMFNDAFGIHADLKVIKMSGWKRSMLWPETGRSWVPTSPHVPHWQTALFMPATGIIGELLSVNIGVGYTSPFELIGAPYINALSFADILNALHLPGVLFRPTQYKPYYSVFKGELCQGVQIHITNPRTFRPFETGLYLLKFLYDQYPHHNPFHKEKRLSSFFKTAGSDQIYKDILAGKGVDDIRAGWRVELHQFKNLRKKYLLY